MLLSPSAPVVLLTRAQYVDQISRPTPVRGDGGAIAPYKQVQLDEQQLTSAQSAIDMKMITTTQVNKKPEASMGRLVTGGNSVVFAGSLGTVPSSLASWTTTGGGVDPGGHDLKRTQLRQPGITWVRAARDTGAGEATSGAHTTNADGFAVLNDHTRLATSSIPTEEGFQDVSEDTDMRSLATYVACAFAAVASGCGLGWEQEVYRREPAAMVAQAVAQDAVTIGWVLPLTLVCTWATHRGSKAARMVRLGCLAYLTYSYVLACVLISRNELFLVYVAAYSTAALALWGELQRANASRCKKFFTTKGRWSASKSLQIAVAAYGLLTSMGAGTAWLMEEIAMLKGLTGSLLPQQSTTALPVQAFDLGFIIPLHVFGAVQLLRGKPVGFFIASVFLVLSSTLVVAIASMAFLMYKRSIVPHDDKAHIVLPCVASIGVLLTICWFHGAKEPKKKL